MGRWDRVPERCLALPVLGTLSLQQGPDERHDPVSSPSLRNRLIAQAKAVIVPGSSMTSIRPAPNYFW